MLMKKNPHVAGLRCVCVLVDTGERKEVKNGSVTEQSQVLVCRISIVRKQGTSSIR